MNTWWNNEASKFDLFISSEVAKELSDPAFKGRAKALEMLRNLSALEITEEVIQFGQLLVDERVMPSPAVAGDALHVAVAVVHRMDYLMTWNVKHLANPNKRIHFSVICARVGLTPPLLVTPDML
jgi:predicted nucleic acid-binding protein